MRVPGRVFASRRMVESGELENALAQVRNVSCLPGIVGASYAMPDIHWGYGFPIGGVAAFDASDGVISPGGHGGGLALGERELGEVTRAGARWAVERGFGEEDDLHRIEDDGAMHGAEPD